MTIGLVKCSLEWIFSIVNPIHGTRAPATTRNRSPRHPRNFRRPFLRRRNVHSRPVALLAGIAPHHPFFFRRLLAPQSPGLRRPRLSRRRRLHGPRQLGHGHRRRLKIRLHATQRHPHQQPDGDVPASPLRKARHRYRARPGPSLPRSLFPTHRHLPVGHL